jgi:hypothetical protein
MGPLPPLSARHGRLRRNAVSPHGVRLGGAPGAPLWIGCSSANRALARKLQWDGIVAVPKVFGAGCSQPSESARSWDAGERCSRPGAFPTHPPALRKQGDARRNAQRCSYRGYLTADQGRIFHGQRGSTLAPRGRYTGSTGLAGSPRRPRNHGRTISERHNRNPQRRANRI